MVAVHPDYADLTRWTQSETTDIVYNDINGTLTERLIEAGYLDHAAWHGKTPMYGIEVKSTEGECDTPFFVSRWQQRLVSETNDRCGQTIHAC